MLCATISPGSARDVIAWVLFCHAAGVACAHAYALLHRCLCNHSLQLSSLAQFSTAVVASAVCLWVATRHTSIKMLVLAAIMTVLVPCWSACRFIVGDSPHALWAARLVAAPAVFSFVVIVLAFVWRRVYHERNTVGADRANLVQRVTALCLVVLVIEFALRFGAIVVSPHAMAQHVFWVWEACQSPAERCTVAVLRPMHTGWPWLLLVAGLMLLRRSASVLLWLGIATAYSVVYIALWSVVSVLALAGVTVFPSPAGLTVHGFFRSAVVDTAFYWSSVITMWIYHVTHRNRVEPGIPYPLCAKCGYPLANPGAGCCSECGTALREME